MAKVVSTLISVVVAIAVSGALWVGFNLLFNQVRSQWERFVGLAYGVGGFVVAALLTGNRIVPRLGSENASDSGAPRLGEFISFLAIPIVAAAAAAAVGLAISRVANGTSRLVAGAGVGVGAGVLIGATMNDAVRPSIEIASLLISVVVFAAIGAGISQWRGGNVQSGALLGTGAGWLIGAFGFPDLGTGSTGEAILGSVGTCTLFGAWLGMRKDPDLNGRAAIDKKSRAVIFLAPSLMFVFATLVVPSIRTILLSFKDRDSEEYVWFDNYTSIFSDAKSFDVSNWTNLFTSSLFWIAIVAIAVAIALGSIEKRSSGKLFEVGGASALPLGVGILFLVFAVFSVLRGTIMNNLWWVFTVTVLSTGLGLAIAVLADRGRFERVAKSLIFMPMAISLVGASIIWRFMYQARDISKPQTGVMNAVWVELGRLSTGNGLPTLIVAAVLGLMTIALAARFARALVRSELQSIPLYGLLTAGVGWLFIRFAGIVGDGVGGFTKNDDGTFSPETVFFVQDEPFNSFWLMVILIWIQTGFAMVILSAAIRAVPTEFIEAAKVDGATESQVFWRIILPQIASTIGVVVTTLIVLVMKVFDIVKVVTNGQFGTQVLANNMFQEAFSNFNRGLGAALAVLILVSVLPVMVLNIRQMQKEG